MTDSVEHSNSEYLRWACEQLTEFIDRERDRRKRLETKTTLSVTAGFAIAAFCLESLTTPAELSRIHWWVIVTAALCTIVSLVCSYFAFKVKADPDLDPGQFVAEDVLEFPVSARLRSLADHFLRVLEDLHAALRKKAKHVRGTQFFALLGATLFLVSLAVRKLS